MKVFTFSDRRHNFSSTSENNWKWGIQRNTDGGGTPLILIKNDILDHIEIKCFNTHPPLPYTTYPPKPYNIHPPLPYNTYPPHPILTTHPTLQHLPTPTLTTHPPPILPTLFIEGW